MFALASRLAWQLTCADSRPWPGAAQQAAEGGGHRCAGGVPRGAGSGRGGRLQARRCPPPHSAPTSGPATGWSG